MSPVHSYDQSTFLWLKTLMIRLRSDGVGAGVATWVRLLRLDYVWVDSAVLCLVPSMNTFNHLAFSHCDCSSKAFCGTCMADAVVHELCELLDDIFTRSGAFGEDEGDDAGISLSLAEMRSIEEDVVKLRSKNILQIVPLDYHVRLLSLLDQHVQRAHGREVDEDDDVSDFSYPPPPTETKGRS